MPTEFNEARVAEKAQEVYNYAALSYENLTPMAFTKAKNSFRSLMQNVCDRDEYRLRIFRQILDSIDGNHWEVAWCDKESSVKIAKVIVNRGIPHNLGLYPETAEKKIGQDVVKGVPTPWGVDEMTVRDMLYFVKAHTEGVDISKATMPGVYKALKEHFGLDEAGNAFVYQAKVLAQAFFGQPLHYRKIIGWDTMGAGKAMAEKGLVSVGEDGLVRTGVKV